MRKGTCLLIFLACTLFWVLAGATAGLAQQNPVIKAITSFEPFEMLVIGGEFGPDPGPSKRNVTVGGVARNITKWEESTI